MINTSFAPIGTVASRPSVAASQGKSEPGETGAPQETVSLSETPARKSWLGRTLGKTAVMLGLGAALFCASVPAANAQSYFYHQPVCGQVQTGSQTGISIDHRGNIGVYTTQQSVNTCNGTVQQNTIGINQNGVVIQQQTGVPGWGVFNGPTVVFPNHQGHRGHHGHHGHHGHGHHGGWHR